MFNCDGRLKPFPNFSRKTKTYTEIPKEVLRTLPRDGLLLDNTKIKTKTKASIKITGTQVVMYGKKISMEIIQTPDSCNIKEYNKIWMHNYRVRKRIKKLKEEFGITYEL
jgi:hypothetical protein